MTSELFFKCSPDKEEKISAAIYHSMFACRDILAVISHTWDNNEKFIIKMYHISMINDNEDETH